MLVYALAIFSGAFLLFQVQPLIAKYILPWFGGGSGVWTVCMLFFQALLVGGYAYAHLTTRWLKPRAQALLHLALLAAALALLPIVPSEAWKPAAGQDPTWRILVLLTATLGLPYLVISATGPLIQQWFSRTHPGRSPYRLYALSNAGSLLALVSYPLFFETHFTRRVQASLWGWGLAAFAACCAACACKLWKAPAPAEPEAANAAPPSSDSGQPTSRSTRLLWLLLPACASILLLATTNKICQDVVAIPFLWVLPLSLYLLSFIVCFDSPRWYHRLPFTLALIAVMAAIGWALPQDTGVPFRQLLLLYSLGLFVCCMVCHGELYRLKPDPRELTAFYLMIALGGASGGLFVAVVAPLIFQSYAELPCGVFLCGLLFAVACHRGPSAGRAELRRWVPWGVALAALALGLYLPIHTAPSSTICRTRNFYGVLRVTEEAKDSLEFHHFALYHAATMHGAQFVHPVGATWPTAYYTPKSGVGLAVFALPKTSRRIGLVGMGAGTLATYARTNDHLTFYEINPQVPMLASNYFSYVQHSKGKVDIKLGDARLVLEREPSQQFDLLVLDAFSGDGVPVHLLTREAFAIYERQLKTNGVIAVHVSNNFIDLEPVLANAAAEFKFHLAAVESNAHHTEPWWVLPAKWVLLTHDAEFLKTPAIRDASRPLHPNPRHLPLWTDDFSSLYQILL